MTALIASLKPEAGSPRREAGEVQDMDAQAGRGFRPNRPGLGKSGVDGDAVPVANREVDRFLGIGDQRRLLGSAEEVSQLVHPDIWTLGDDVHRRPLRPTHSGSLWRSASVVGLALPSCHESGCPLGDHDRG